MDWRLSGHFPRPADAASSESRKRTATTSSSRSASFSLAMRAARIAEEIRGLSRPLLPCQPRRFFDGLQLLCPLRQVLLRHDSTAADIQQRVFQFRFDDLVGEVKPNYSVFVPVSVRFLAAGALAID
jgi:hypothetical protein